MLKQEEEVMSSQLKVTTLHNASTDRLFHEMAQRLQAAAGRDIKDKLATGDLKIVNSRYVTTNSSLKVQRASVFGVRPKDTQLK